MFVLGKNKVAAQNCRKRKLDQIMGLQHDVDGMFSQKDALQAQHDHLLLLRQMARDKYAKLYNFILEASSQQNSFNICQSDYSHPEIIHQIENDHNSFDVSAISSESISNAANMFNSFDKHE